MRLRWQFLMNMDSRFIQQKMEQRQWRRSEISAPGDYELVLMDIQMPVMNGYEAAKQIRALDDPALAEITILAMTANAFDEDRKKALECWYGWIFIQTNCY